MIYFLYLILITLNIKTLNCGYLYGICNPEICFSKCCDKRQFNGDSDGCYIQGKVNSECYAMHPTCDPAKCLSK